MLKDIKNLIKLLMSKILFQIDKNTFCEIPIIDIEFKNEENKFYKIFKTGDKIFNNIIQLPYKNKHIVRIYSTERRTNLRLFVNIIFDINSINYSNKAVEQIINLIKFYTWSIEKSGSIKTSGIYLRKLLKSKEIINIIGDIEYSIFIGVTTEEEKELFKNEYNKIEKYFIDFIHKGVPFRTN